MSEFRMPSLGADMETGTLVEWMVEPGDAVKRGHIIAAVETEKGIIEIEVFEDGVIEELVVEIDTQVPVGTVLAMIRADSAPVSIEPEVAIGVPDVHEDSPLDVESVIPPPASRPLEGTPGTRLRASPLARRLATQLGIDLSTVEGTGPDGAIERADVERVSPTAKTEADVSPSITQRPPVDAQVGMRRAIAAAMTRSNREIPHYYLETRIDMSHALHWLEARNQERSIKDRLLSTVLLLKAVACALGDVPELNGYWHDDRHELQDAIHIGFAIALRQGGLVTPALQHVDRNNLDELMAAMRDLIMRARTGRLRSSEMTDATITVTNLGDLGVETVYGVIYPPQVAIVGFGKIIEQPWAEKGMLGVRPALTATLAADHRATDGRRGAQFLEALNHYLQEVETL